jgi:hypothetical protein
MGKWRVYERQVELSQALAPRGHHLRTFVRSVIICTVLGEVICLIHFGIVARDWAAAYAIGATWIKDNIRKWFLE